MIRYIWILVFLVYANFIYSQCWDTLNLDSYSTRAIKSDGSLWTWGSNVDGLLGDGTFIDSNVPTYIASNLPWKKVVGDIFHALGLKADGTLWAWGLRNFGILGDGSNTNTNVPIQIGISTGWSDIACGEMSSWGIKSDGTLWAWGGNQHGQLGIGASTSITVPTPIQVGIDNNWKTVSAAHSHIHGIKTDGTLWGWGFNNKGQLGDGTTVDKNIPVQIGNSTNWKATSDNHFLCYGIKTDGTIWATGDNYNCQLGLGFGSLFVSSFTQIGNETDWKSVSAGSSHALALKTNGTIWTCGSNYSGQLGNGTTNTISICTLSQVGIDNNWKSVSAGPFSNMAVKVDGSLWGWGFNGSGNLGDGTNINKSIPVNISCPTIGFSKIDASKRQFESFPNPTSGKIYFDLPFHEGIEIKIYDVLGKEIQCYSNYQNSSPIDVSQFSQGIYYYSIKAKETTFSGKFIKE